MFSKYDLHEAMGYRLGEMPFLSPPTPTEMRKGLARAQYYCTILNRVANIAEHEGWTGEDKYVAATFYLLLQNEQLSDHVMRRAMLEPMPFAFPDRPLMPMKDAKFCDGHPTACDPPFSGEKAAEDIFGKKGGPYVDKYKK